MMTYLCIILVIVLVIRLIFITKRFRNQKPIIMAALAEFQTQIDSINSSLIGVSSLITNLNTQITTLTTELGATLSGTDAATALQEITDIANKLSALVPPAQS